MVYDGIILSLLIGFLRGGSLKGIAEIEFKYGWVFIILIVGQLFVYFTQNHFGFVGAISNQFFMFVYIIGMFFLWINRHHEGFTIILVGVFLNFLVMAVNGGRMPVSEEASAVLDPHYIEMLKSGLAGKHALLTDSTILPFLGDILPLQPPYPRQQVISIGDIVMNVGVFLFIQKVMLIHRKEKTEGKKLA
ncbi:DUF5317 domain-containing protein [Virgibacillus byunsanensis]|uniref:DUF5317 domain-containing protein n=1 Tax=Virgibacillus byunsanensis TaxID=570945 RepID=A0ABW3LQY7_9BACI